MKLLYFFLITLSTINGLIAQTGDTTITTPDNGIPTKDKEEKPFVFVAEMPEYKGGTKALMKFIGKNVRYPEQARKAGIEGKGFYKFVVMKNGKVDKVEVVKGVPGCPECDAEAVRVIKKLRKFKPGKNDGKPVAVWFQLPLNFILK
jgi:periplasmic protein TonB